MKVLFLSLLFAWFLISGCSLEKEKSSVIALSKSEYEATRSIFLMIVERVPDHRASYDKYISQKQEDSALLYLGKIYEDLELVTYLYDKMYKKKSGKQ